MLVAVDSTSTAYHIGQFTGLAVVLVLAFAVVRRALGRGFGQRPNGVRDVAVAALAIVLAGAFVVAGVNRGMFESSSSASQAWSSQEGINVKAGFLAGCSHGIPARDSTCECVFKRISAAPPYNTPLGFEGLASAERRFAETRDVSSLPPAVLAAVRGCTPGRPQ